MKNVIQFPHNEVAKAKTLYLESKSLALLLGFIQSCINIKSFDPEIMMYVDTIEGFCPEDANTTSKFIIDVMLDLSIKGFTANLDVNESNPLGWAEPAKIEWVEEPTNIEQVLDNMDTEDHIRKLMCENLDLDSSIIKNVNLVSNSLQWPTCNLNTSFYATHPLRIIQDFIEDNYPKKQPIPSTEDKYEINCIIKSIEHLSLKMGETAPVDIDAAINTHELIQVFNSWSNDRLCDKLELDKSFFERLQNSVNDDGLNEYSDKVFLLIFLSMQNLPHVFGDANLVASKLLNIAESNKTNLELSSAAIDCMYNYENPPSLDSFHLSKLIQLVESSRSFDGTYPFMFSRIGEWVHDQDQMDSLILSLSQFLYEEGDGYDSLDLDVEMFNTRAAHIISLAIKKRYPELAEAMLLVLLFRSVLSNRHLEPWNVIGDSFYDVVENSNPDFRSYLLGICTEIIAWPDPDSRYHLTFRKIQRIIWKLNTYTSDGTQSLNKQISEKMSDPNKESASDMPIRSHSSIVKLIKQGEGRFVEFKSSLRWNINSGRNDEKIQKAALKTVAAFLNGKGGTLLIGVNDEGEIVGIKPDGFKNNDKYLLHIDNLIRDRLGSEFWHDIYSEAVDCDGCTVVVISCQRAHKPVYLKDDKVQKFFIRCSASTQELQGNSMLHYIQVHFN